MNLLQSIRFNKLPHPDVVSILHLYWSHDWPTSCANRNGRFGRREKKKEMSGARTANVRPPWSPDKLSADSFISSSFPRGAPALTCFACCITRQRWRWRPRWNTAGRFFFLGGGNSCDFSFPPPLNFYHYNGLVFFFFFLWPIFERGCRASGRPDAHTTNDCLLWELKGKRLIALSGLLLQEGLMECVRVLM